TELYKNQNRAKRRPDYSRPRRRPVSLHGRRIHRNLIADFGLRNEKQTGDGRTGRRGDRSRVVKRLPVSPSLRLPVFIIRNPQSVIAAAVGCLLVAALCLLPPKSPARAQTGAQPNLLEVGGASPTPDSKDAHAVLKVV